MNSEELFSKIDNEREKVFLHQKGIHYTYLNLLEEMERLERLYLNKVDQGTVVSIEADFSLQSIALLLLVLKKKLIGVPLIKNSAENVESVKEAHVQIRFIENEGEFIRENLVESKHPFIQELKDKKKAGLIVFSTGSTGKRKASLHDFERQLLRFSSSAQTRNLVLFLFFDHLGGIHTLLHVLSTGGRAICLDDHSPETVWGAIIKNKIEILPTSPTFLKMSLLTGALKIDRLTNLKVISFGTEPMPESTLKRLKKIFPDKKIRQTYGTTETGSIKIVDHPDKLNWFKIDDPNVEYKIVKDILFIKSKCAMLGYLNADSPFDDEGYYNTRDSVISDGDYLLINGRKDDIINVGGQKVLPPEVEDVLISIPGILDATVTGKEHPIFGHVVHAVIQVSDEFSLSETELKKICLQKLSFHKIPLEFKQQSGFLPSNRNKKVR